MWRVNFPASKAFWQQGNGNEAFVTARKKSTTTASRKKTGSSQAAGESAGGTKKPKATKKAAKKATAPKSTTKAVADPDTRATKATKVAKATKAAPKASPKATKKTAATDAPVSKKKTRAAAVPDHPAAAELNRTWGSVLNGPIIVTNDVAIAAAEVTPERPGRVTHLLADYLADHDEDAAVQALHDNVELGSSDAPWARARIEADYRAPARFEDERPSGTMLEATFVAVFGDDSLSSVLFVASDRNGSAGLAFGHPRPDDESAEAIATAFWLALITSDAPLTDFTDRANVRSAGGSINFGVQDGQPFMDEDSAAFSDDMDLTDVVSRRAIAMNIDGGDDESIEDDDDQGGDDDGFDDYDRDDYDDDDDEDEDDDEDDRDDDYDDNPRRPDEDEDFLSMLLDNDD